MNRVFRVVLPGALAAIVVALSVGFLAFTFAPPVGGPGVSFYARLVVGIVAGLIGAGIVWFAVVLIAQKRAFEDAGFDEDEDPFDDPFFDR